MNLDLTALNYTLRATNFSFGVCSTLTSLPLLSPSLKSLEPSLSFSTLPRGWVKDVALTNSLGKKVYGQLVEDYSTLSIKTFEKLCRQITTDVAAGQKTMVGIPVGKTSFGFFELLNHLEDRHLENLILVCMDEYAFRQPDGSWARVSETTNGGLQNLLFTHISPRVRAKVEIHFPDPNTMTAEEKRAALPTVAAYDTLIRELGIKWKKSETAVEPFFAGVSKDTFHIGFNDPGTPINAPTHITDLHPATIQGNLDLIQGQEHAITVGPKTMLKYSGEICLLFNAGKAEAVHRTFEAPVSDQATSSYTQHHARVTFIMEADSAAMLRTLRFADPNKQVLENLLGHEINNPLTGVLGNAQLAELETQGEAQAIFSQICKLALTMGENIETHRNLNSKKYLTPDRVLELLLSDSLKILSLVNQITAPSEDAADIKTSITRIIRQIIKYIDFEEEDYLTLQDVRRTINFFREMYQKDKIQFYQRFEDFCERQAESLQEDGGLEFGKYFIKLINQIRAESPFKEEIGFWAKLDASYLAQLKDFR